LQVRKLDIPEVLAITPARYGDARGYFCETYNQRTFAEHAIATRFVQDNQSLSSRKGTIRGLHFQKPPYAQAKLVRAVSGSVYDVAVDIRRGSPTYGRFAGTVLSAENGVQLYIPAGFAHGFCTLEDGTEVVYKVSDFYSREHDAAVFWDDPAIGVPWPLDRAVAQVSEKDAAAPGFAELQSPFGYP
jgi:dTDP-4-dehydrorhamnose 3,5-epimerase